MGSKSLYLKALLPLFILSGCMSIPTPQERLQTLRGIISHCSLTASTLKTSTFDLFSIRDNRIGECTDKNLNVYIEGDGLAWRTSSIISDDPTPINPLALKLMTLDPDPCKVYIARPCQYVGSSACNQEYWTNKRFSNTVIASYQEALNQLKEDAHNKSFTLIGYSGGGAIALLSALNREDVKKIVTIAGNIDTDIWVKNHHLNPLTGSLNPADYAQQVENIEQWHFIGKEDNVVPKYVFDSYLNKCMNQQNIHFKEVDATHSKNWEMIYSDLLKSHSF
jgi:hypothetical protein